MSTSAGSPGSPGAPATIPAPWLELVDDAAIFPPGDAPLPDAVAAYRERRDEPWAPLVGPLVVSDRSLPDLGTLLAGEGDHVPVPISVVCSGGAGSLGPAAHWAGEAGGAELRALEIALRDLDDLPGSARRVVRAAEAVPVSGVDVPVYVEVPLPTAQAGAGWLDALDEIAAADLRLKFRTGGPDADLVPTAEALAAGIEAALDRELAFKCTAGLHHAVRHHDTATGSVQHGFLNVLLATRASLDGQDATAVLATTETDAMLAGVDEVGADALARARRWFTSFGCCGVQDPYQDLVDLGLV